MPTYQYVCTECGHDLEAVQSFSDDALTQCPQCGGRLRKVFSAVGVVFKGSGFYRTDSRGAGTDGSSGKGDGPDKGSGTGTDKGSGKGSDKGSDTSTDGGRDTKKPAKADASTGSTSPATKGTGGSSAA